jgi:lipopolysaccharide exporter
MVTMRVQEKIEEEIHFSADTQQIGKLTSRVLSGSAWVLGVMLFSKGLGAIQLLILGRILAPNDYGLFAVASMTLLAFDVLTRTGFNDALIQKRGNIESYADVAFMIQIMRGLVLAALVFFTAPYAASFFNEPKVAPVVSTLALVELLRGFRSPGIILLQRELNFQAESRFLATGDIITIVTTICLAFSLRSVWALVYGVVVGEAALMVLSYIVHPYRPRFSFDLEKAKELYQFGIWLFLSGIVSYLAMQADNIAVGRLLSTEALGIYFMAYRIGNLFVEDLGKPLAKTLQPAYAMLQDNAERLRAGLEKSLAHFLAIFCPIAFFLMLTAQVTISVLLGDKWNAVIPILPILVLGALFRGIAGTTRAFFVGTGRPRVVFFSELLRAAALLLTLYPFFVLAGLEGIAWASTFSTASKLIMVGALLVPIIHVRSFLVREMLPVGLSTALLSIVLLAESTVLPVTLWSFVVIAFSSIIFYSIAMWLSVNERAHLNMGKLLALETLKRSIRK